MRYEDAFEDAGGIILGEGRQVVVRQAIRREDRAVVAVRRLTTRDVSLAELHRQLSIFELVSRQCVHRNIVKIEGLSFSDDDESLHVMFKIYRGGELLDAIVIVPQSEKWLSQPAFHAQLAGSVESDASAV